MGSLDLPSRRGAGARLRGQFNPTPVPSHLQGRKSGPPALTPSACSDLTPSTPVPQAWNNANPGSASLFLGPQEKRKVTFTFLLILSFSNVNRGGKGPIPISAPHQTAQQSASPNISSYGVGESVSQDALLGSLDNRGGSGASKASPIRVWQAGHLSFELPGIQEMQKGMKGTQRRECLALCLRVDSASIYWCILKSRDLMA